MHDKPARVFHTCSLAEYHDPFLRRLLSKYVSRVESPERGHDALTSDSVFASCMNSYKQVVTHFFACKFEMWLSNFMAPVFGIDDFEHNYEFAKTRGAIHAHGAGTASGPAYDEMDKYLSGAGVRFSQILAHVDEYIRDNLEVLRQGHDMKNPLEDASITPKTGLAARIEFLKKTSLGQAYLQDYEAARSSAVSTLQNNLGALMENHFAVSAMHVGIAPTDWRKPAGHRTELGYRDGASDMLSKSDVLGKAELRQFKFQRESSLCERRVNMDNHIRTHSCSDYCWRRCVIVVPFEEGKHVEGENGVLGIFESQRGDHTVKQTRLEVWECRMGFGHRLFFARAENDRTGGIAPEPVARISFGLYCSRCPCVPHCLPWTIFTYCAFLLLLALLCR